MGRRLALRSSSAEDTRAIAAAVAQSLFPGDVVALSGDLGAGKTCFVQGAAAALGVAERVTSPSFVLVREYQGTVPILHLDVYRLNNLQELTDLGYEEFLDPGWVVFIEWGNAIGPLLPTGYLEVLVRAEGEDARRIELHARGGTWDRRLGNLFGDLTQWLAKGGA